MSRLIDADAALVVINRFACAATTASAQGMAMRCANVIRNLPTMEERPEQYEVLTRERSSDGPAEK